MLANVWRTRSKSSVVLARSREERERTAVLVVVVDLDRVVERRDAESRRAMISDVDVAVIGNNIIIIESVVIDV